MNKNIMIKTGILALLSLALMAAPMFGQSSASLRGTVTDATAGVMPGATVTATNTETGVEQSATVNAAGVYNFPALQPGTYTVVARNSGFQAKTVTDVRLRAATQSNLNLSLEVMGTTTQIDVVATAETMILESGSSTGTVLQENLVSELPLVGSNVMELLNAMGGVIKAEEPIFGASNQSFAGISGGAINITRDGVSASDIRYNSGVSSTSYVNQELVGEFKMILSPVDAELGRGAGQVQITTKSGGNTFHGSGNWNNQNTVLDARKFNDKLQDLTPAWRNLNNYTISASGPIIKNKTFFFASWDQQIVRSKDWMIASALTNCARKGIYRYYGGVVSKNPIDLGDYRMYDSTAYPRRVTVTSAEDGTPKAPDSGNGILYLQSVFGDPAAANITDKINCSDYNLPTGNSKIGNLDGDRDRFDQSGYVSKFFNYLPEANYFGYGDGLNIAGYKWWRTIKGTNNIFGTGEDNRRKQFTVKIDHNLTDTHRLSGTYTIEKNEGEDGGVAWPENSYIGRNWRKPQSFTASLTSTLAPTLLNEFRFGYSRVTGYVMSSIEASNGKLAPILNDLTSGMKFPNYKNESPIVVSYDDMQFGPILGYQNTMSVSHPYMSRGLMNDTWGGTDNSYNFSETMTWMKGTHSFKGGVTVKINQAWYFQNGNKSGSGPYVPGIRTGDMGNPDGLSRNNMAWNWPGIAPYTPSSGGTFPGLSRDNGNNNQTTGALGQGVLVSQLLNFLSGTVNGVAQGFYIVKDGGNYRWNDVNLGETGYITDLRSRELSFFFKDDWRLTSDLTLNLGVRYEYFGVPWEAGGMTAALAGGARNIQGNVGPTWMKWLGLDSPTEETMYQFVGPNSDHSDLRPWNRDMNNFAPHVGFSYQLPWWGRGLTTLRGGYSISYSPITNFDNMAGVIATVPGTSGSRNYLFTAAMNNGLTNPATGYTTLADVAQIIGARGTVYPTDDVMKQIRNMSGTVSIYDENIRNPYTQSMNLSLTRQIGRAFTVDVRYVGNLTRNLLSATNLNTANYMSNRLFEEFKLVRANGTGVNNTQIPVLSSILGGRLGSGPLGTTNPNNFVAVALMSPYGVSDYNWGNAQSSLANGDFNGLAGILGRYGAPAAGVCCTAIKDNPALANNFIFTNPELASANISTNDGFTNYHSMQAQVTMRPMRGLSFQSTYTWSRNLMDRGVENYDIGSRRYYLADQHRSHSLTTYGSYELPFGANGFFFRDVSGALKKAIEGWGLSWVANISSGAPMTLGGGSSYWGIANPDVVRPDLWDNKGGKVEYLWNKDGVAGKWDHATFYGDKYVKVADPSCYNVNLVNPSLQTVCANNRKAIALKDDPSTIVIQNAEPGTIGNLAPNSLTGPGRWTFDLSMAKAVEFMEGKRIDFRIDAANIFNHATPSGTADTYNHAPRYDVINLPQAGLTNTTGLGYIATKSGHRTFQAKVRISF